MDIFNEKEWAAAMGPVLEAVTRTAIDRASEHIVPEVQALREELKQTPERLSDALGDLLDGLSVTVTFSKKPKGLSS